MNKYTLKQQGEAQHGTESYRLCFCCCWFVCRNMVLIYFKRRTQNKRKFGTTVFKLTSVKMLTKNVFKISLCLKVLFATLAVTVKKKKTRGWTLDRWPVQVGRTFVLAQLDRDFQLSPSTFAIVLLYRFKFEVYCVFFSRSLSCGFDLNLHI